MDKQPEKSIFMLGANHRKVALEIREKLAISKENETILYDKIAQIPTIDEFFILNTCNRVEFYCVANTSCAQTTLLETYSSIQGLHIDSISPNFNILYDIEVIKHLFNVASGIDSQMLGETEILGQVKEAYKKATEASAVGPILNRIAQRSFQAAKWARTHTDISKGNISIGNIAAELAERIFGDLAETRILVVGCGEVGEKTLKSLYSRGARDISITNRTFETAATLASNYEGTAIHFDTFRNSLSLYDIVICSTASNNIVLNSELTQKALNKRHELPLFLIDLSLPRNICSSTASLPNTYLYDLDDLAKIANENLKSRQSEIHKCNSAFERKVETVWDSIKLHKVSDSNQDMAQSTKQAQGFPGPELNVS